MLVHFQHKDWVKKHVKWLNKHFLEWSFVQHTMSHTGLKVLCPVGKSCVLLTHQNSLWGILIYYITTIRKTRAPGLILISMWFSLQHKQHVTKDELEYYNMADLFFDCIPIQLLQQSNNPSANTGSWPVSTCSKVWISKQSSYPKCKSFSAHRKKMLLHWAKE